MQKVELVKMLLMWKDVNSNTRDNYGKLVLYITPRQGYEEVMKILQERNDVICNTGTNLKD